jgi:hypothetical protein
MEIDPRFGYLLTTHELQYAAAIGVVAVLILLLVKRRPQPASMVLFLVGSLLAVLATPLLEDSFSAVDTSIANGSSRLIGTGFWRALLIGAAAAVIGVLCIARAWRDSPER